MDYKKCLNVISNTLNDLELEYEIQKESDNSLFILTLSIEELMEEVITHIVLFDDGCLIVNMKFNKIEVNEEMLRKIMSFNKNSSFLKCILDSKDNVNLIFSTPLVDENTIEGVIKMLLYEFTIEEQVEEFKEIIG